MREREDLFVLADADWLDRTARRYDEVTDALPPSDRATADFFGLGAALAVARAYLGTTEGTSHEPLRNSFRR
jgi:hypothetical protein